MQFLDGLEDRMTYIDQENVHLATQDKDGWSEFTQKALLYVHRRFKKEVRSAEGRSLGCVCSGDVACLAVLSGVAGFLSDERFCGGGFAGADVVEGEGQSAGELGHHAHQLHREGAPAAGVEDVLRAARAAEQALRHSRPASAIRGGDDPPRIGDGGGDGGGELSGARAGTRAAAWPRGSGTWPRAGPSSTDVWSSAVAVRCQFASSHRTRQRAAMGSCVAERRTLCSCAVPRSVMMAGC